MRPYSDKKISRIKKLKKQLEDVPLSWFRARDIPLLHYLFSDSWQNISNANIDYLEKIIKQRKKK